MPNITNKVFKDYVSDLEAAAKDLEKKHNIRLVRKGGTLGGAVATVRFEMQSTDEVNWAKSDEAKAFLFHSETWDLTPEDLGAVFYANKKPYKLVGCVPSRTSNPFLIMDMEGKTYKGNSDLAYNIRSARKARQTAAE